MKISDDHDCKGCGYRYSPNPLSDEDAVHQWEPMVCGDCHEVVPVLTGTAGRIGPIGIPSFDEKIGRCALCKGSQVITWEEQKPCPKCGTEMEAHSLSPKL